jgi:hypothetical protein
MKNFYKQPFRLIVIIYSLLFATTTVFAEATVEICTTNAECSISESCYYGICENLSLQNTLCRNDNSCSEKEICTSGGYCGIQDNCAGFPDIATLDPLCIAIQYVKNNGIFSGYENGTFAPNKYINRAEAVKTIMEAFNYETSEDDGTNLGYSDVIIGAWYMPYLKTAQSYEIMNGYPDGTLKPEQTLNKVELLKILFTSAQLTIPECKEQPYPDTPKNGWYSPYVCYAKENKLIDPDEEGNFNPEDFMQRGEVAELLYRYHERVEG